MLYINFTTDKFFYHLSAFPGFNLFLDLLSFRFVWVFFLPNEFPGAIPGCKSFLDTVMKHKPSVRIIGRALVEFSGRNRLQYVYKVPHKKEKPRTIFGVLAPAVGLEPTTLRLTAACSAIELCRKEILNFLLEPTSRTLFGITAAFPTCRDSEQCRNGFILGEKYTQICPESQRILHKTPQKVLINTNSRLLDTPFSNGYIL